MRLRLLRRTLARGFVAASALACSHVEPPTPAGIDPAVSPLPGPSTVAAAPGAPPATSAPPSSAAPVTADAAPPSSPAPTVNDAGAEDPGKLAQTNERPKGDGPELDARVAALWDGVVNDDPERAMPFFFPLSAYEQVKDVGNPAADWRRRLVANYKRDIHALHAELGSRAERAKLVRIEIPERARWVEPGGEYNKVGYFRVYDTRIIYTVGDGARERIFPVTSLISWRGAWYVVHLTGFK